MGKKLDALLGRTFKAYKLKSVISLAVSRLAVLKNQRQSRCSQARSDVVQLLQLGQQDRALHRVEQVIKEQNMLDVFVMLEGYCNLLIERVHLIEQDCRVCPEELEEAISGLLFASSRCGEFPELLEIRAIFMSRYGKEFAARAIELRNNCGVNTKIVQKLSTRQPDLESRMKVLEEIAAENKIVLQSGETSSSSEEKLDPNKKQTQTEPDTLTKGGGSMGVDDGFSDSAKARKQYRDVADAAQAAFESAAYAAEAARAAVELSRSDSHDPDDRSSPHTPRKGVSIGHKSVKLESDSKGKEVHDDSRAVEVNRKEKTPEFKNSKSTSSEDSADDNVEIAMMSSDEVDPVQLLEKETVIYDSDSETHDPKTSKLKDKVFGTVKDEGSSGKSGWAFNKQIPSSLRAGLKLETGHGQPTLGAAERSGMQSKQHTTNKGRVSVRTRQVHGY